MVVISQQDQFINFVISLSNSVRSLENVKLQKSNRFLKKTSKLTLRTTAPFHYSLSYQKLLKELYLAKHKFLNKKEILYRFQSGFKKNCSTNTCLRHLTGKITPGFEKGIFTGMILIDLQKAFDTIDHQTFIKKMKYLGFSKNVIAWLKSYLSERKLNININTSYSSPSNLIFGVPQGSILGPLLFLLCINVLSQAIVSNLLLYADDTSIVFQHKNVTEIEKQLLTNFSSFCDWFVNN